MDNGASSYRRFLDGDDQGLYEIICAYQSGLVLYLNSMVQNIHTAEDLAEGTFAELVTKMPRYSGKSSFKTWLYAIARHLAADHIRKCAKLPTVPLETQEFLQDEVDVEHAYLRTEQREAIHRALHRIQPDYRAAQAVRRQKIHYSAMISSAAVMCGLLIAAGMQLGSPQHIPTAPPSWT